MPTELVNRRDCSQRKLNLSRVHIFPFSSVQFSCSVMSDSSRPHESQHVGPPCPSPTPGVYSNSCFLCRPLLLLPSIFPSIRVFSNESALCIRWPKYWSLSCSISLSNEYSGLISFRIDWFDLLAVQGTLKTPLQALIIYKYFST